MEKIYVQECIINNSIHIRFKYFFFSMPKLSAYRNINTIQGTLTPDFIQMSRKKDK